MNITEHTDKDGKVSKLLNETLYDAATPDDLIYVLEDLHDSHVRVHFTYGDPVTGKLWEFGESGYIGRSFAGYSGTKIPLVIYNNRSMGGGHLMDHRIMRIEHANKRAGGIIYNRIVE